MSHKFECPVCGSYRLYPYREVNVSSLNKIVDYQCMECFKHLRYQKMYTYIDATLGFGWVESWVHDK